MKNSPLRIKELLAKHEDRLLYSMKLEVSDNVDIISDLMVSFGIYMSAEMCCKRILEIEVMI